jgi:hypothetical protein
MNKIIRIIASTVLTMLIISGSMCATAYAKDLEEDAFTKAYETVSSNGFISKDFLKEEPTSKVSRSNYEVLLEKLNTKLNIDVSSNLNISTNSNIANIDPEVVSIINKDTERTDDSSVKAEKKIENAFKTIKPLSREEALSNLVSVMIASNIRLELSGNVENIKLFDDYKDIDKKYLATISTALQNNIISINEDFLFNPKEVPTYQEVVLWLEKVNEIYQEKNESENPFFNLDPTQNIKVNPEVDEDGNIVWNTVNQVLYYTVLIKSSDGEVVYESEDYTYNLLDPETVLESGNTYEVIIGAILEDTTEIFSNPVTFKYMGIGDKIVEEVKKYLGVPYVWGGTSPRGFDCSGLTQYVSNKVGIKINRVASDQYRNNGKYVSRKDLIPGDLVYFGYNGYATHTGVYVGDGQMIHAPQTGDVVKYASIDNSYFKSRFLGGKRVF